MVVVEICDDFSSDRITLWSARKQLVPKQYGLETNAELVEKLLKDRVPCIYKSC